MRLRRKREIRLRSRGQFSALALLLGLSLCGLASAAATDELLRTVSHANISGALLSLCLLTAPQIRK
jgi:hypothetical protein